MGLDQYAYATPQGTEEQQELAYWRKHNRLQGWMEDLWEDKGRPNHDEIGNPLGDFNCVPVEITLSDLEQLEAHVTNKELPETGGFFFGDDSFSWTDEDGNEFADGDYHYKETDLKFIEDARKAIEDGKKVFYNCWW
tara:strand:- start:824 stop:1234 length:411 start_codon:yes stop_codon:yes gene_type:complete